MRLRKLSEQARRFKAELSDARGDLEEARREVLFLKGSTVPKDTYTVLKNPSTNSESNHCVIRRENVLAHCILIYRLIHVISDLFSDARGPGGRPAGGHGGWP